MLEVATTNILNFSFINELGYLLTLDAKLFLINLQQIGGSCAMLAALVVSKYTVLSNSNE